MIVVSNASPLISLAKIKQLELLQKLFSEILITEQVHSEAAIAGPGAQEIAGSEWIKVVALTDIDLLRKWRSLYGLGAGEISTLLLAKEYSADLVIIDEKKARQLARKESVRVVGTVGILEESCRRNYVKDLRTCYQGLIDTGTYINLNLLNLSLRSFDLPTLS